MDAPKKGKTKTAAQTTATQTDKSDKQAVKKKHTTNKDGTPSNSDKDKKPQSTDATKTVDDTSTSIVQKSLLPKRAKKQATSVKSAPDKNPAAANKATSIATQEQARTAPVTAPQVKPIATGAEKTEPRSTPAPATFGMEAAAATSDKLQAPSPTDAAQSAANSSPVSSTANKTKKSALLHATKKTSPLSLFTQAGLHKDCLLSVTSADDWQTKTKNMTKGEKDELTNWMAAFILSLEEVNTFVPDTFLLKTTPPDLQSKLRNLIATSPRIASMKDFVQPYAVTHESGKNPAGFHGKGLNALVDLLDERVNVITLWKHLRGALSDSD